MSATQMIQLSVACLGLGLVISGVLDMRKRKKQSDRPGIGEFGQIIAGIAILIFCLFLPWVLDLA